MLIGKKWKSERGAGKQRLKIGSFKNKRLQKLTQVSLHLDAFFLCIGKLAKK